MLPIREHVLDQLEHGDIRHVHLTHQQHSARHVGGKMQLLGTHIHVAGENVVRNDVLDEGSLVVLFLKVCAGLRHADGRENADAARRLVIALDKHGILKTRRAGRQNLIRACVRCKQLLLHFTHRGLKVIQARADHRKLTAGNDKPLLGSDAAERNAAQIRQWVAPAHEG